MEIQDYSPMVEQMKEKIRQQTGRSVPFSSDFSEVKKELRIRRKLFLGSDVPVGDLVKVNGVVDDSLVRDLSHYLTIQSVRFCGISHSDTSRIFDRFYSMSIYAFCEGSDGDGCLDDLIFSAECLARSRGAFVVYMKNLLPKEFISELFSFTELYADFLSSALFIEAVLGAVCALLGVIEEPRLITNPNIASVVPGQKIISSKEALERARHRAKN